MDKNDLYRLKKKADKAERMEQQLKGERRAILSNMKDELGCSTIEEAKALQKKLKKKSEQLAKELEEKLKQIEKEYIPDEDFE